MKINSTSLEEHLIAYLNSDELIHFSAATMWVHGKQSQNEDQRCIWLFDNGENCGEEGHKEKTFTYAFVTTLTRVKRDYSYIHLDRWQSALFDVFSQFVATKLTSERFKVSQSLCS